MKVSAAPELSNLTTLDDVKRYASQCLTQLVAVVNGNIGIPDNLFGQQVTVVFSASNSDTPVDHTLNKSIVGYLVLSLSDNMVVYNGTQASTNTRVYLRSSAAGTAKLLIF